jgi:hypothetical protein
MRSALLRTFLNKPAEVHAAVGGVQAARHGREDRVVALAFGEVEPRSPLEADIQAQGWYALGAMAVTTTLI